MTFEEAVKKISEMLSFAEERGNYYGEHAMPTYKMAIQALEKQIPKKPYVVDDEYKGECCMCSNCDEFIVYKDDCKLKQYQKAYCPNCGQALDWSDVKRRSIFIACL